jgi:2-hydroxychromene-2-carboxylate isomerase
MKHIDFYLDFISPYAYLAFEELPKVLEGLSYSVRYKPVFLGALLKHNAMLGPAEVTPKRDWTYRHVLWLAHTRQLPMAMPERHPFNPLGLLRLAVATNPQGQPNRYVCETLLRHVWVGGADAADPDRLAQVSRKLAPVSDLAGEEVKAQLKQHADEAIALGVFGVPAMVVDGKVFWGLDSLPMLRAYLQGDSWFTEETWNAVKTLPSGLPSRKA